MIGFTKTLFFIIFYNMKNTRKDRYDKHLLNFIKEWNKAAVCSVSVWDQIRNELMKKYGFTDEDWHRAIRLTESKQYSKGYYKHTNSYKDKSIKELRYDDHCDYEEKDIDDV